MQFVVPMVVTKFHGHPSSLPFFLGAKGPSWIFFCHRIISSVEGADRAFYSATMSSDARSDDTGGREFYGSTWRIMIRPAISMTR